MHRRQKIRGSASYELIIKRPYIQKVPVVANEMSGRTAASAAKGDGKGDARKSRNVEAWF